MAENIASQVNSLAKGVMLESGDANIQAYYGPYTSLDNAVAFFQNNVEPYLLYVPAGYKVGIGTQETVGGLPTWTSITQEYIYIGGGISKAHFVPVIMNLDTEYTALKTKVNGIATGAEVNQNAFGKVKVGSTNIEAEAKEDTLELVAGSNVTITPDTSNDKVTIAATDTTYNEATTSAAGLLSASDKAILNQLVLVVQDGGWNVDSNFQVSQGGGSGSSQEIPANLQTTINRITNILGDLYDKDDNTGNSDGQIIIENDGNSNN